MKQVLLLLATVFCSTSVIAQLPNFSLQVSKTDETCLGNGSITITTSNVPAGSSLLFKVYKMPDTTNAVSIGTAATVGSLTAGTYKVIAIAALGNSSNTQEKTVVINNNTVPFDFTITSQNINCMTGASIVINAGSGIPVGYEIVAGPQTRPMQSSNVFTGLPSGSYNIRAYDNCGVAKVKTYTLSIKNTVLSISDLTYPNVPLQACDSIKVANMITASEGEISYPLQVQYRVLPMSITGEEIIINQLFATGSPDSLTVSAVLPRYASGSFIYELSVIDGCNTTYEKLDNEVDCGLGLTLTKGKLKCAERYLEVTASKYKAPYTIEILNAPAGFTASSFNAMAPGPFATDLVEFGGLSNPIPFGEYVVKITDACGRIAKDTIVIEYEPLVPEKRGANNGCFSLFGSIQVSVPQQLLVSATIMSSPAEYTAQLPQDVTAFINAAGKLVMTNMPIGTYELEIIDDCGFEYTVTVVVPPFVERNFAIYSLPSCEAAYGSVEAYSHNGPLVEAIITSAPSAFQQPLPYSISSGFNAEGHLIMYNLPAGEYVIKVTDHCGIIKEMTVDVKGYTPPANGFVYTPGCGTFSVKVTDDSNGTAGALYFLQKYYPASDSWGHPQTSVLYTEGEVPALNTGIKLYNHAARNNLALTGKFRVIKMFYTMDQAQCISVFGEFEFTDVFSINNAYTMSCTGNANDVYLEAEGQIVAYRIEKKDGVNFTVDNGLSHIFTNLEPATYLFSIEDVCGNKLVKEFNLRELPSVADATRPADMHICIESQTTDTHTFHLTDQNALILNGLPSAMYTITYHLTQADADAGTNALPEYYTNTVNGQVLYARLINNHIDLCYGTTSFALYIGDIPTPQITTSGTICNGEGLALTATAGFDNYLWSTGETTRTIFVSEPGNYTVVVEKDFGTQVCSGSAEVAVAGSGTPSIVKIDTNDWTMNENAIVITAQGASQYQYSLDGINFQNSNVFTNLACGAYQVYVKDAYGCGMDMQEVVLMNYPNFFTPNGDGHHDTWRIEYSVLEPHLQVTIFDRYGKVITSFGSSGEGWDGTYNGTQLPSTDYWFVVTREDGRELRGHFAMLR